MTDNSPATPPEGTISLLFTDIEGSTDLSLPLPQDAYRQLIAEHNARLRGLIEQKGYEVDTAGDSFFATFDHARDALACAVSIQKSLRDTPIAGKDAEGAILRDEQGQILYQVRVRIGIYRAAREIFVDTDGKYVDREVNLASRIGMIARGEQILVSESAYTQAGNAEAYAWEHYPNRRLKNFKTAETVHELL